MSVTVATPNNITSPEGNGFAVYKDSITNKFMVKDIYGKVQQLVEDVSDASALNTGNSIPCGLSINTDPTKFNISAGYGYIVDGHSNPPNSIKTKVEWDEFTGITPQFLATNNASYIAIDINGAILQTVAPLDSTQRRNYIRIGLLVHPNNTFIFIVNNTPTVQMELGGQVQDILNLLGFRSVSGNRILPANSTGMQIRKEDGVFFKAGANFNTLVTQPHFFLTLLYMI